MSANLRGFATLLRKEIDRIIRIGAQTFLSPIVTTTLYFVVFGTAIGSRIETINGVPYIDYIVPGLIMMNILMSSFMNSSFSLYIAKFQRSIQDILVTPISYFEIAAAYAVAAVLRGFFTGFVIWLVALLFTSTPMEHPLVVLVFVLLVCIAFSILGIIIGIVSKSFDHVNILPTFVITPLSFLGGVFYSIKFLPEFWQKLSLANPLFYMIDGLRFGFFGISDINPWISFWVITAILVIVTGIAWAMLRVGYKLKS